MLLINSLSKNTLIAIIIAILLLFLLLKKIFKPKFRMINNQKSSRNIEKLPKDLEEEFKKKCEEMKNTKIKTTNEQKLKLYALYKQALYGPCIDKAPPIYDMTGRAKWDSWKSLKNTSCVAAAQGYIAAANNILHIDDKKEVLNTPNGMIPVMFVGEEKDFEEGDDIFYNVSENNLKKVMELIDEGIDINIVDEDGLSALHWACDRGYLQIVEYLISKNANVNIEDSDGSTPLHYAISSESYDCASYLIRHGADINHKNNDNETPLELCEDENEKKELLSLNNN